MNKWTGKSILYIIWSVKEFWVVTFFTTSLFFLQCSTVFAQEDNKNINKNLNTPFFGQDPAQLGQQYTDQEVADQKKIDAANKTKSKDKNVSGSTPKQNLPPPSGSGMQAPPPNYTAPPVNTDQNTGVPSPSEVPKPAVQPAPSNELMRGY